jgi:purine-binding chemotaxis protein CheW
MKNVIVFALGGARYAVELRWVREVITLGHVTPVPTAPSAVGGAVNVGGAVVPVLELAALREAPQPSGADESLRRPRKGDGAILVVVDGVTAAVRMSNVETVTTLRAGESPGMLADGRGGQVPLLDMPALIKEAHGRVAHEPGADRGANDA